MAQLEKIMSIYYGSNKLPYKDEDRQTHYPIAGETNTFVGENNTTKVRFFVDRIGGSNYTWVAKVKKPNGTICFRVLEMDNDDYVDVDLSFLYTDQVGQIDLALNGYTAQDITITEDDGVYEISGNPTVICTGIIKIIINYAPLILNMGATVQPNEYQQILALLSTKLSYGVESEKVNELPATGKANTIYYVKSNESDIVYDIYYWNGTTFAYLGTTAYDLYTKDDGITFENALRSYVNTQLNNLENEIQQVVSGSPKGVYATLSDLESAYPTGADGIYVVSANGNWYYWSGSAWTSGGSYLSQLADNELDENSINPVQNKVITKEIYSFLDRTQIDNVIGKRSSYNISVGTTNINLYANSLDDNFTVTSGVAKTFNRESGHKYLALIKTSAIASSILIGLWNSTSVVGDNNRVSVEAVSGYSGLYANIIVPTTNEQNSVFVTQLISISTVGNINALGIIDITSLLIAYPNLEGQNNVDTIKNVVDFVSEATIISALTNGYSILEMIKQNKVEGISTLENSKASKQELYDYLYERTFSWQPINVGGFTNTGQDDDSWDARLRTQKYLLIDNIQKIKVKLTELAEGLSFRYSISFYEEIGEDRIYSTGWVNLESSGIIDFMNIDFPIEARYIRMILSKPNDTTMYLSYIDEIVVYRGISKELHNVIVNDRTLLKRESATIGNYLGTLSCAQAFCKYNGKYVSVEEGKIAIQDSSFVEESSANITIGHANSIQLGNGDYAYVSGWNDNKLYKVDLGTLTVAQTINLPTTGWTTCAFDETRQLVYIFQRDTYPSTEENYNFIIYDISTQQIVSTKKISVAFLGMQSCDYYQDKIIVLAGNGNSNNKYMVFDTNGNLITTYEIPSKESEEPEGVFIDRENNGFYISFINKRIYKVY